MEWLVAEHGVSVSERDAHGSQPVHLAVSMGQVEMLRWLLMHGADANAPGWSGATPMQIAFSAPGVDGGVSSQEVVTLLGSFGAGTRDDEL